MGGEAGVLDGGGAETMDAAATDSGPALNPMEPVLLSQTGLYANFAAETLAPGVHPFQPQYGLWSDSATKRRWVYLPPGKKIDSSDMEFWAYPPGFKLWKEFSRNGVRVETRLLMKRGEGLGDWFMVAYKWRADKSDADAVPKGEMNASGTQHDIPSQENCSTCHGGMWDNVLGFAALQLSHNLSDSLNLTAITSMGWLTNAPAATFVLPGDAVDKAALGYMHANCGMCHNLHAKVYSTTTSVDLWTHLDQINNMRTTRAYLSSVCDEWPGDKFDPIKTCTAGHTTGAALEGSISKVARRVTPGNPAMSALHELMSLRGDASSMSQMPPVGTEIIDPMGIAAVDAWINKLP